jgi:hypothetical protein
MAVAAEEHGREILEVYLQAMRGGDWRAAERTGLCALIDGGEGGYFNPARARAGCATSSHPFPSYGGHPSRPEKLMVEPQQRGVRQAPPFGVLDARSSAFTTQFPPAQR